MGVILPSSPIQAALQPLQNCLQNFDQKFFFFWEKLCLLKVPQKKYKLLVHHPVKISKLFLLHVEFWSGTGSLQVKTLLIYCGQQKGASLSNHFSFVDKPSQKQKNKNNVWFAPLGVKRSHFINTYVIYYAFTLRMKKSSGWLWPVERIIIVGRRGTGLNGRNCTKQWEKDRKAMTTLNSR